MMSSTEAQHGTGRAAGPFVLNFKALLGLFSGREHEGGMGGRRHQLLIQSFHKHLFQASTVWQIDVRNTEMITGSL